MKTITLDEDAYRRLLAWKRAKGDSFSKVIKRVVPEAGTLGAMAQFVSNRQTTEGQDALLEASIEERSSAKHDPWT
jgi:predicted CopG family antitoxin